MMKIGSHMCNQGQPKRTYFTLTWYRGHKTTLETIYFFTRSEAEAAHIAVTQYCARHNVHASELPRAAISIIIEALKQGKDAPIFVAALRIASGAAILCRPSKMSVH